MVYRLRLADAGASSNRAMWPECMTSSPMLEILCRLVLICRQMLYLQSISWTAVMLSDGYTK